MHFQSVQRTAAYVRVRSNFPCSFFKLTSGVSNLPRNPSKSKATVTFYSAAATKPSSFTIGPSSGGNHDDYNYWGLPRSGKVPPPPPPPAPPPHCFAGTQCNAHFSANRVGCCPYENAVCCPNAMTCCPHGSTCTDDRWQSTCVGAEKSEAVGLPICKPGAPLPFSKTLHNVVSLQPHRWSHARKKITRTHRPVHPPTHPPTHQPVQTNACTYSRSFTPRLSLETACAC